MPRNGKQRPARPRIEVTSSASPEEAAAIAAAIEQFLRDTAPVPAPPAEQMSVWGRAALLEATGRVRVESPADVRRGDRGTRAP